MPLLPASGQSDFQLHPIELGREVKVSCIATEPNGKTWLGLDGDGLAVKESMEATPIFYSKMNGNLSSDVILCTYLDKQNRRWFGTFGDGVFYFKNGAFTDIYKTALSAYPISYCTAIIDDQDSTMWFGTNQAGLFAYDKKGRMKQYAIKNTILETNTITDLKPKNDSIIYVATGWGLYLLNTASKRISTLTDNKGNAFLAKRSVRFLMVNHNKLWIGTKEGVYVYNQTTREYHHLVLGNGLDDNTVKAICIGKDGCVWVTSIASITRIMPDYSCTTFGKEDIGEVEFHVRALACTSDGQMLFGTLKGLMTAESTAGTATSKSPFMYILSALFFILAIAAALLLRIRKSKRLVTLIPTDEQMASTNDDNKPIINVNPTEIEIHSADTILIEKAKALIEEHLSDADYTVENLSSALGMSRGHLYKRIMTLTGMSPLEFIRKLKVERGKQLLEQSGGSISEIAWQVGFSPKQFSKYFKETYKVLPSEFIKRQD